MSSADIFNKIPELNYSEQPPEIDPTEFEKVIRSRRSVRVYKQEKIPEEIMNKCLDLALLAPNSSNLQAWDFYWVRTPEVKSKVVEACFSQPSARTAAEIIVCVGRTGTWRMIRKKMLNHFNQSTQEIPKSARMYYEKLVPFVHTQGPLNSFGYLKRILFFFRGLTKVTPRGMTSKKDMETWATKSTALACQNLMLAFRAYGYDSCPMEGYDWIRLKKALKLPKDAVSCMVISAGKRADNGVYGPQIRFERELFIKEV